MDLLEELATLAENALAELGAEGPLKMTRKDAAAAVLRGVAEVRRDSALSESAQRSIVSRARADRIRSGDPKERALLTTLAHKIAEGATIKGRLLGARGPVALTVSEELDLELAIRQGATPSQSQVDLAAMSPDELRAHISATAAPHAYERPAESAPRRRPNDNAMEIAAASGREMREMSLEERDRYRDALLSDLASRTPFGGSIRS